MFCGIMRKSFAFKDWTKIFEISDVITIYDHFQYKIAQYKSNSGKTRFVCFDPAEKSYSGAGCTNSISAYK